MGRIPPAYNQNDWPLELGRLVALAERFASEGQMNLNKLVEAAVYVQVRRAGWRSRPQVTAATGNHNIGWPSQTPARARKHVLARAGRNLALWATCCYSLVIALSAVSEPLAVAAAM